MSPRARFSILQSRPARQRHQIGWEQIYICNYCSFGTLVALHSAPIADRRCSSEIRPTRPMVSVIIRCCKRANLHSHENRLPKCCMADCPICNSAVWAANAYTPERLYDFYSRQMRVLQQFFPGRTISYQLIQDGFLRVSGVDEYHGCFTQNCDDNLPGTSEQTESILMNNFDDFGIGVAVQHNGLGPWPGGVIVTSGGIAGAGITVKPVCLNHGIHSADTDSAAADPPSINSFSAPGSGCPNRWVLHYGERGQLTGIQTNNTRNLFALPDINDTLQNAEYNSGAVFVELYEEVIWLADVIGGELDANAGTPRELEDWNQFFVIGD